MFLSLFIKGILIGLAVSVPLGPIGLLIIQRTVNKDRTAGILSGMGASLSDTIYALVAGYSLTYIIDFIQAHQITFQLIGALIILLLGVHIFVKNPVKDLKRYRKRGSNYFQDLASTFLITFPNPMVVFIFLAVFASSGIVFQLDQPYQTILIVSGVFIGANSWWLLLTGTVSFFRHKFNLRVLWWFNKIAGALIIVLVLVTLVISLVENFRI
ncbi:MAG: LysE family translocator [Mangrovibacterium sp.]